MICRYISLMKSYLFIFAFGVKSKKSSGPMSLSPMFSSRSFMVSGLRFKSLMHFSLLHVSVQFSQHHLLKRLSFPHCMLLCAKLIDHICVSLFLDSLFSSGFWFILYKYSCISLILSSFRLSY